MKKRAFVGTQAAVLMACRAALAAGCHSASSSRPAHPERAPEAEHPPPGAETEETFPSPHGLPLTVKMVSPVHADVDLQVITLFDRASRQRFVDVMVELNDRLGGFLNSVRDSGHFRARPLETLAITTPAGSISARNLLIVGLGASSAASLELLTDAGAVAVREAVRLRASTVAFAPALRDQEFLSFQPADVGAAVMKGVILAYDTERRLQQQALSDPFALEHWYFAAGPAHFAHVVQKVGPAIREVSGQVARRDEPCTRPEPPTADDRHTRRR